MVEKSKKSDVLRFFRDHDGEIRYCDICNKCTEKCKQSFRILDLMCNKYKKSNS